MIRFVWRSHSTHSFDFQFVSLVLPVYRFAPGFSLFSNFQSSAAIWRSKLDNLSYSSICVAAAREIKKTGEVEVERYISYILVHSDLLQQQRLGRSLQFFHTRGQHIVQQQASFRNHSFPCFSILLHPPFLFSYSYYCSFLSMHVSLQQTTPANANNL